MHVPDGFLSLPVSLTCAGLSAAGVAAAATGTRTARAPRAAARMGVTAAFVFAAQMLNFPIIGGTSGHLVGGVLAAVLVGPASALVVMAAVLVLQCLLLGDGGLLSLGANVLNMAIVDTLVGFATYRVLAGPVREGRDGRPPRRWRHARRIAALALGAWVGTVAAAVTCAGELALSHAVPPGLALAAMAGVHVAIGAGEALISAFVLATILRLRPEWLDGERRAGVSAPAAAILVPGAATAVGLALFVSPFACRWPDGLERAIARLGLEPVHARIAWRPLLSDHAVAGLDGAAATAAAGAVGTLVVLGVCAVIGVWLAPKPDAPEHRASRS